jgi:hypothetical protein
MNTGEGAPIEESDNESLDIDGYIEEDAYEIDSSSVDDDYPASIVSESEDENIMKQNIHYRKRIKETPEYMNLNDELVPETDFQDE